MQVSDVFTTWKKIGPATKEGLLVFGALLLVVGLVFLWAAFIRKRGERKHYRYPSKTSAEGVTEIRRKKVKKRRKEHRPRNPTLSETGGLPPIRSEADPGPAP